MTTSRRLNPISVENYLAGELVSPVKHEYLGGSVYEMGDFVNGHNFIVANVTGAIHRRLRRKPCRVFNSATKIRIRHSAQTRFYYPDASVICRSNAPTESFQDEPVVIVEVLSKSTRRIDEGEKRDAYLTIPSLQAYLLVEQDSAAVLVLRRKGTEFIREVQEGMDAVIALPDIDIDLPLAEIYEDVDFLSAEPDKD